MQQLFPNDKPDDRAIYRSLDLPHLPDRPYILLNMVATLDGKALIGERVQPIGGPTDRYLMKVLRSQVDAVMSGAGTLRAHQLTFSPLPELQADRSRRGQRDRLFGVVFSDQLDIPIENRFFEKPAHEPVVVTTAHAPPERKERVRQKATLLEVGETTVDLRRAMELLKERFGIQTLLSEGGPRINYSMFAAGLIDELFLTLAPKVGGGETSLTIVEGPGEGFPESAPQRCSLISAFAEADTLFLRYRVA